MTRSGSECADPRFALEDLEALTRSVLLELGARSPDADAFARGLVVADARGVESHGVARLPAYVRKIEEGLVDLVAVPSIVSRDGSAVSVDGNHTLGQVAAEFSMNLAIECARTTGVGFVATRRSNHFGIAGYYAAMALQHGMIGLCGTNTGPIVAPTFGRTPMLGTNPLAVAAPTSTPPDFLLDMATSAASGGKLQVAIRAGRPVPHGWGIDGTGADSADPGAILGDGALLPLGSFESLSSYKGFGLAMVVEILAGVLGGGVFGPDVIALTKPQRDGHANVSHVFGAIDISRFLPLQDFRERMDAWFDAIRSAPRAPGADRIYIPGEKEWELEARHRATGVPLMPPVVEALRGIAARLRVQMPDPVVATGERHA